ncbi:Rieske (2Fe-2S) protein [Planosporangium thailandense]|uniref:Cytochrome bc1 complex Rieske iron-sulfur subunit n=1 Tax=Planosporangium thailandense TaxID=765197 RepID=A0ABX0XY56_9ACTN|nr:Rieske (2Fe-2S) protein [Planosporangium thailandense]NJC70781.1 Rieske (2Fe-2S) protein [Planosporangium thailandense]
MGHITRRGVLVGGVTLGGLAVGGCATERLPFGQDPDGPEQGPRTAAPGQGGEGIVATVDQVPVGGGQVLDNHEIVVTQPTAGNFKCFRAVCTHQGCLVNRVADGRIDCPCHGSQFSIANGSVLRGPATRPLEPRAITIQNDQVRLLD